MPHIVDVHNHFYPDIFVNEVERDSSVTTVTREGGETHIHYAGDYSVIVPAHRDPALRVADMDRAGIERQILSLTVPGIRMESAARGAEMATQVNDAFAETVETNPARFGAFAARAIAAGRRTGGRWQRSASTEDGSSSLLASRSRAGLRGSRGAFSS